MFNEDINAICDHTQFVSSRPYVDIVREDYRDFCIMLDLEQQRALTEMRKTAQQSRDGRLHETIADIAYLAGQMDYYSGDSRADISTFISWAHEFEKLRTVDADGNERYNGTDYMSAIEGFARLRIDDSGHAGYDRLTQEFINAGVQS